jgi:hypothetical protein
VCCLMALLVELFVVPCVTVLDMFVLLNHMRTAQYSAIMFVRSVDFRGLHH